MVKIIDNFGMVWVYSPDRGVIQCLEGLEEFLDKDDLEGAQENGYPVYTALGAINVLISGGYVDATSPLIIIDDYGGVWRWMRDQRILQGLSVRVEIDTLGRPPSPVFDAKTFGDVLTLLNEFGVLKKPLIARGEVIKILPAYRRGAREYADQ